MFKTTVELTLTTQKAHACSPFCCVVLCWAGFFVFDWKDFFLGKLGPKTQNCQVKLKFCT